MTYANLTVSGTINSIQVLDEKSGLATLEFQERKEGSTMLPITLKLYGKNLERAQKIHEKQSIAVVTGDFYKQDNAYFLQVDDLTPGVLSGFSSLIAIGYVGTPPEHTVKETFSFTKASIAVNKYGVDTATWINFTAFGKTGEVLANYVNKGSFLTIRATLSAYKGKDSVAASFTATKVVLMPKSLAKSGSGETQQQTSRSNSESSGGSW